MAGIALTLYYIFPARLGYKIVTLEKQIHDLEQQQKLLEVEEAQARSLGRIESIATTRMAMLPMEDRKAAIAVAHTVKGKSRVNRQQRRDKPSGVEQQSGCHGSRG